MEQTEGGRVGTEAICRQNAHDSDYTYMSLWQHIHIRWNVIEVRWVGAAAERTKWKTAVCSEMGGQGCWVASRQTTIIDQDNFLARQTIGSPRSQELDLRLPVPAARELTLCADQECGAYKRGRRRRNPSRRLLGKELGYHFSRLRLFEEGRKGGQTDARTNASSRKS